MKKAILSLAVLSALSFSAVTHAASVGATGTIKFDGGLTAPTCTLSDAGATSTGTDLQYPMGMVATTSLGTEATPATAVISGAVTSPTRMNLKLACSSGSSVELKLTPTQLVGRGIGVYGGAEGVQVMLMYLSQPVDFSGGFATLMAPLSGGIATFVMDAYYTLQAGKSISDAKGGLARANLAYVLSYN